MFLFCLFRMLLEKSSGSRLVFSLTVSGEAITLRYGQSSSRPSLSISFKTEGRLGPEKWTHVVLQVRNLQTVGVSLRDHCPVKHAVVRQTVLNIYCISLQAPKGAFFGIMLNNSTWFVFICCLQGCESGTISSVSAVCDFF